MQSIVEPEEVEEVLIAHLKEKKVFPDQGPLPWTIRYSSLGGRGLFATRDIEPGELIYVDAPLLIGPRCVNKHLPMCVGCYKRDCPLFPCDHGCGLPVCSTVCENSTKHTKFECEYLRSLVPTCGTDWSRDLLLAVILIRALFLTEQQRKCLAAFEAHPPISRGYEIELLLRQVKNSPTEDELNLMQQVCWTFNTNSFETVSVQDKDRSTSLRGLYPMGALQNHCCVPKTRHYFDADHRLYTVAALPIAAGEELTMSYTSLFWDTMLRRQFLNVTKRFFCHCSRCSDTTEFGTRLGALLCATEDCSGNLFPRDPLSLESSWVCDKCSKTIKSRQIAAIRSGVTAIVEEVLYKTPRQIFKFMQNKLSRVIPPNNYLMVDLKFRIISYFGRTDGFEWPDLTDAELTVKRTYCNDLIFILESLNCGDCQKKGLILYELYCTNFEIMKRLQLQDSDSNCSNLEINVDENERLLEKALSIIKYDIASVTLLRHDGRM